MFVIGASYPDRAEATQPFRILTSVLETRSSGTTRLGRTIPALNVIFRRTGPRRYAVIVEPLAGTPQAMDPAPGYDDDIPHDLVHYAVEAELGLDHGVFGRAAKGGGTFTPEPRGGARELARRRRKQHRREERLAGADGATSKDMVTSERLAALVDLAWRRRHGQRPEASRLSPTGPLTPGDEARIEACVAQLDALASQWRALPVGGELVLPWPRHGSRVTKERDGR